MPNEEKLEIRDIRNGDWYWIDKAIIHFYMKKLRASGIAVYNALASFANSKTQTCFPTQKAIAEVIGLSRRTVMRRIKLLKELGLIKAERKKGCNLYYLLKPKVTINTREYDKGDTCKVTGENTNNNYRIRNINNIDNKNILNSKFNTFKREKPKTREELLALDLAEALHDSKGLPFYLSLTKKYPESLLRQILGEVKEVLPEKIKKSRGALFNYLIQRYAQKASHNISD